MYYLSYSTAEGAFSEIIKNVCFFSAPPSSDKSENDLFSSAFVNHIFAWTLSAVVMIYLLILYRTDRCWQ